MDYQALIDAMVGIVEGDKSLVVNGASRHFDSPVQMNERNHGFGILAEKEGKYLTAGGYKNSEDKNSYYAGGGVKKRYGNDYYIEPGVLAGVVSGYKNAVTPMVLPTLGVGKKNVGALNFMYTPETRDALATLMMNMSIPLN